MKRLFVYLVLSVFLHLNGAGPLPAGAIEIGIGDNLQSVRVVLGEPRGHIISGRFTLLYYDHCKVKLRDNRVTLVETMAARPALKKRRVPRRQIVVMQAEPVETYIVPDEDRLRDMANELLRIKWRLMEAEERAHEAELAARRAESRTRYASCYTYRPQIWTIATPRHCREREQMERATTIRRFAPHTPKRYTPIKQFDPYNPKRYTELASNQWRPFAPGQFPGE